MQESAGIKNKTNFQLVRTIASHAKPQEWRTLLKRLGVLPLFVVILIIIFGIINPRFLTISNMIIVARQCTYLAIISLGQMAVLLVGGFDLSVGSMCAFTSIISTNVMLLFTDPFTAIFIGILVGIFASILVGLANGVIVAKFEVPPFIVTLGMMEIVNGLTLIISAGTPVFGFPDQFSIIFGLGKFFGIPLPVIITFFIAIAMFIVINWTQVGRYFWAIGGNFEAAALSGISVKKYIIFAYALCGLLSGITGILLTARVASGEPHLGAGLMMESLVAAVIGGVAVGGGAGNIPGVLLGAIFISILANGMNLANIGSYIQIMVLGCFLILAVIIDRYIHQRG
jgi:ribose transport system permease protein